MRRVLLTCLALWTLGLCAQTRVHPYLSLGSNTVLLHDKFDDLDAGSAFRVGAGCYIPLSDEDCNFYLVPELAYSSFRYDNHGWAPRSQAFRYEQLHLPVVADYRLNFYNLFVLDLGAGPFVSYGLGGSAIGTDGFGRWNAGVSFRTSVRLLIFTIGLSYDLGLVDIQHHGDGTKETLSMIGLNFGLGF